MQGLASLSYIAILSYSRLNKDKTNHNNIIISIYKTNHNNILLQVTGTYCDLLLTTYNIQVKYYDNAAYTIRFK